MRKYSVLLTAFLLFVPFCKAVDGDLDVSFNSGGTTPGTTTLDIAAGADDVLRGVVWYDGTIIVAGRSSAAENVIIAKYNADGSLNTSFNSAGTTPGVVVFDGVDSSLTLFLEDTGGSFDMDGAPNMVAIQQEDGKIIVVGAESAAATSTGFGIIRINADGTPDTTFGGTGKVTVPIGGATVDIASTVLLLPDGKILVAGTSNMSGAGPGDFTVVRLNSDGSLDTTFGTLGIATRVLAEGGAGPHRVRDMALQSDGKIVLCGQVQITAAAAPDFILVRFNSDGTVDTTFGAAGTGEATIANPGDDEVARQMVVKPDGKIFVVGNDPVDTGVGFIAQFNPNGTIDTTFDPTGRILISTFAPFAATDSLFTVALEPDGRILIAGSDHAGGGGFIVGRLNAVGNTLDTSFGAAGTGEVTTTVSAGVDQGRAMILQPDGKILVIGSASGDGLLAVARYHNNHGRNPESVSQLKYQNLFSK